MAWGRRKDTNQPYVKGAKRGVKSSKTNSVSDVHLRKQQFGNNLSKEELEKATEKTRFWSYPQDWLTHKKYQMKNNEPYLYFNETGIHIMHPNDADYGRLLPNESDEHMKKNFDKISQFILEEKERRMEGLTHDERELYADNIETDVREEIKGYEDIVSHLDEYNHLWSNLEPYLKQKIIRIEIPELSDKNVQIGLEKSDFNKLPLYDRLVLARGMKENLPKESMSVKT